MLRNYLKIAWRILVRKKAFSFVNITGLAVGIAASLLLFVVVRYELGYDSFQKNYANIYRIVTEEKFPGGVTNNPGIPVPALAALRNEFPDIVFGSINAAYGSQLSVPAAGTGKKFIENNGMFFCDQEFFKVFSSYTWLLGKPEVLQAPNTVVLDRKTAEKYFGDWQKAYGGTLQLDNGPLLKVNGIIENSPAHSDFPIEVLISMKTLWNNASQYDFSNDWGNISSNFQVYALLPPQLNSDRANNLLAAFSRKHYPPGESKNINLLQPLSQLHFDARYETFGDHISSKATIWTLSLIGFFILLMACINFVNLSTGMAVGRSKEVGIRKVMGGNCTQLFWQVIGETTLIVAISVALALVIARIALPYVKHIASIAETPGLFSASSILLLFGISITVILLSGLYPALVISGFNPSVALKNKISSASVGGISLRRSLVVLQFAISQVLIAGTIVALGQMNYVRHADLGFNKEALYVLHRNTDSTSLSRQNAFKQDLLQIPGVQSVSFCSDVPSSDNNLGTNFGLDNGKDQDFTLFLKFGDKDYVKTFGLQLLAGRNYESHDSVHEALVNETLIHKLGIHNPAEAIGRIIRVGGDFKLTIAGVLKDFKTNSLRETIKPLLICSSKNHYDRTAVKMYGPGLSTTRKAVDASWNKFYPEYAVNTEFLDQSIEKFYVQEEQLSLLYKIFAGLAVFISCLGLYGLVSFMVLQKIKEVGIRKVLGASVMNIVYLFSKEFTLLIGIAFLIAVPVAWYFMNNWLNNFVYRINISWWVFLLAVVISVVIAWLTVGYKALRAAIANPVQSLRSE